jgi:hypothetical protein
MGKHEHFHDHEGDCCRKQDEDCCCQNGAEMCDCGGHFQRRYQTKEEERSSLESYLADLKLEVQAVEEHLETLKK